MRDYLHRGLFNLSYNAGRGVTGVNQYRGTLGVLIGAMAGTAGVAKSATVRKALSKVGINVYSKKEMDTLRHDLETLTRKLKAVQRSPSSTRKNKKTKQSGGRRLSRSYTRRRR